VHPLCLVPECGEPAATGALVALCADHLALAADSATASGCEDVLPTPCPACASRLGVRYPSGWLCAHCEWRNDVLPDTELLPPRVDVVYYLRFDERYKIGTTGNLRQRLGAIRHHELVALERGDRHRERMRHGQFAATRHRGTEWFAPSPELDAHLVALRAGVDDPWAQLARWRSEAAALRS